MTNKNIAFGIWLSLGLTVITGVLTGAGSMTEVTAGGLYSVAGLGYFVFGVWGAIRLNKLADK